MIVSSKRVPSWTVYHPSPSGLPEIDYKLNIAPSGSGLQLSIGSHKMEIFKSMLCTVCQYYLLKYIYLMQHQPVKLLWLVEIILTMALMHYPIINGMIVVLKWPKVYIFRWFKFTHKPPYSIMCDKLWLAIWETSFWTFLVKFGLKGPWDIS